MTEYTDFVGIDISKDRLDIHVRSSGERFAIANSRTAATKMLRRFPADTAFACEASGGYERALLLAAGRLNRPVFRLHPADVRAFARLKGKRAKTDPLDARLIAAAAAAAAGEGRPPAQPEEAAEALRDLMLIRDRCLEDIKLWKGALTRMSGSALRLARARLRSAMAAKKTVDAEIARHIAAHEAMAEKVRQITSVPGAGPVLATTLTAFFPELGSLSARQAASLTGVAPHPRQSGASQMRGRCSGGRARIRRVLYMAALSVVKARTSAFAVTYTNLREKGKPHKVALVAVMRKMIVAINTIIKEQRMWQPR